MVNLPVATILIINHNYGNYVVDAINSALKQVYDPTRMVVCILDDNSTDDSWKTIHDNFFKQIPHSKSQPLPTLEMKEGVWLNGSPIIALRSSVNLGPSEARNTLIRGRINETDVFAVLDADDVYYPEKLLKCVNQFMQSPENIGVVYADYDILNVESGNTNREYKEPFDKLRLNDECIVHSGAIISKQALVATYEPENGFYDKNMRTCEDYDLWMRISEKFIIVHVPESLSLVRVHKQNSTFSVNNEIWNKNWTRIREKTLARNAQTNNH